MYILDKFVLKKHVLSIALITTVNELYSDRFFRFVYYFFIKNKPSRDRLIKLNIFIDKPTDLTLNKKIYRYFEYIIQACSSCKINLIPITELDNNYCKTRGTNRSEYGLSSGPNISFFYCAKKMSKEPEQFFLLLELDCIAVQNFWFDCIEKQCKKNFWINGSKYKGKNPQELKSKHLNGVAIYKNSNKLHSILEKTSEYIKQQISQQEEIKDKKAKSLNWMLEKKNPVNIQKWLIKQKNMRCKKNIKLNYDVGIYKYMCENFSHKQINKKLIDSGVISDFSLVKDADKSINSVLKEHPKTIILHKKSSAEKNNSYKR